jgi:cobalt-zinc-cadmium resistance protein CzcA
MFTNMLKFILSQRLLVIIAAVVLAVMGLFAWEHLPIDAFPDVSNVQVVILSKAPGLAPVDVEQQVTFPIELAMQGLPRVRLVRSLSKPALSQVIIVFEDDVDIYFARQIVFERLQDARDDLPESIEPELGPISTGLGEIYQYTLESDSRSPMDLRTIQDWIISPQLRPIPGVNEVNSFGGYVKQYHILVNPQMLVKYGITLRDVLESVGNNNANAGGNFIIKEWEQAYIRTIGLISGISDIESIVLKANDGTPLFLKDVAEVKIGPQTRQGAVTRDGKGETVAGMVIMLRGSNSKLVVDEVKSAIPSIQASLPDDVKISPFYDRTMLIQACIQTVATALMQGGIFVVIVLFLFLGNLRTSLIVALSLPFTAFITFILMGWQGVTANLMSLGGLAIAIGMIVDASIVISENITRHLSERSGTSTPRVVIVYEAVQEVAKPIIFAILIIVIVFFPLFTLEQMEGKMFKPLATTMCFAMLGSLLVSLTIVPVLCLMFVRGGKSKDDNWIIRKLKGVYLPFLSAALRRRKLTLSLAVGILLAVLALLPFVGTEFLPKLDEGAIAINVVRLPSASLDGSVAAGTFIEQRLKKFPEVETVVTKTGRAEISEDPMGPEQNDVFIMLYPKKKWKTGRSKAELVTAIQEDLSLIPGLRLSFSQPIALRVNELLSGIKSDLAIKVFGPEIDVLKDNANAIAAAVGDIPGAEDVKVEQVSGFAQIEVVVDRKAIARHRINLADVNEIIETAVGGKVATTIIEGQMRFAALVRFPEENRKNIDTIKRILVPAPEGQFVPLGQLAEVREAEAPAQISRENNMRRVVVECNIRGRDMGGFVDDVKKEIKNIAAALPTGYFLDYGGQFENQQRAMNRLSIVVPVSIALIFIMLFSAFGSLRSALLVLANLPFALVGGILAIVLLRINLSVSAAIGFIALFGMAVENGTVLVTFFIQLQKEGLSAVDSVMKGCDLRFRPLVMTALTTLLGLMPMIYATGNGSEIQRPLATVVLGGLISSMLLTLIVLPVLYCTVESRINANNNLITGEDR